jgi:hypothetical protein
MLHDLVHFFAFQADFLQLFIAYLWIIILSVRRLVIFHAEYAALHHVEEVVLILRFIFEVLVIIFQL